MNKETWSPDIKLELLTEEGHRIPIRSILCEQARFRPYTVRAKLVTTLDGRENITPEFMEVHINE